MVCVFFFFFFSSRRRHTRWTGDWSSDVCSSDLEPGLLAGDAYSCVSPWAAVETVQTYTTPLAGSTAQGPQAPGEIVGPILVLVGLPAAVVILNSPVPPAVPSSAVRYSVSRLLGSLW